MKPKDVLKMFASGLVARALARLRSPDDPTPGSRGDPYAWKPAPLSPRPNGRSGAVAVAEPDDPYA